MNETANNQSKLEGLRQALTTLQSQTLPEKSQKALKQAIGALKDFEQELAENEEHQRLAALYRVSQALGSSLDQTEVLEQVMDAVIGLTGGDRGFLMLQGANGLEMVVGRNFEKEKLERDDMLVSRTVIEDVIAKRVGIVTTNAQEDPRFAGQESVVAYSLRSILCAPLRFREDIIGVIYVDHRLQSNSFDQADLDLLNAFAGQAAMAIANARLYTQTDQERSERVKELESLARIGLELNRTDELDKILAITHQWALGGSAARQAWIALRDAETPGQLTIRYGADQGKPLRENDPLLRGALSANTPHYFEADDGNPARVVAPILLEDGAEGVIVIEGDPLAPGALQFLGRLANLTAAAMDKLHLYDRINAEIEARAEFVSVVAHELRLPMTSIQGYTDLLRQGAIGEVNEQQLNFLDVIRSNVLRMNALVSGISDISKAEGGRLTVDPKPAAMRGVVEKAVTALKERLSEMEQTIDLQVDERLIVQADAGRLEQVFKYLLDNAAQYADKGKTIIVTAKVEGDRIRTTIKDSGYGIASEDLPRVFEQFFRSDDQRVRDRHGWGLGLTVSRNILALMDGEIGLESQLDKGTTVWFILPARKA